MTKEERKALKKAKAIANKPIRDEKKRQRMLKRSKQLERKANQFLAEAKRIAQEYQKLTEAKKVRPRHSTFGN